MMTEAEKMSLYRKAAKKKEMLNREFYYLRSILGNDWAIFYCLLGGREAGKSYACTSFFIYQWKTKGRPFYWLRLTEASARKLLMNKAEKLIDPDIRRRWNLDLEVVGDAVYEVVNRDKKGKIKEKKLMARVLALNTFYNDKGSGLFDKDFLKDPNMFYNIACDEFQREKNERNTFDIVYAFTNQIENIVRSTKQRLRIILIGNTLEEASDIMCCFDFIPEKWGRYYLRKKRCVVEYMEPSEKYKARREGTVADILMPKASTFTNEITVDKSLVYKGRLDSPNRVIMFSKNPEDWFTIWDGLVIKKYCNEKQPRVAMLPYLDERFIPEQRNNIMMLFDNRVFKYRDLITFKKFQKQLALIRPKK